MSLLKSPATAHAPAVKLFAKQLRAGDELDRALLLNLREEDRVPIGKRKAFHAALARSRHPDCKEQFREASIAAERALPVPAPLPANLGGTWWHHVSLAALQKYKYMSKAQKKGTRAPLHVRLKRPIGQREDGTGMPFWITNATSTSANDVRDRLGLCLILRGQKLYRISIGMSPATARQLFVPSAVDAGYYPAWRHPGAGHPHPWGLTRHLETDVASERELLALPDAADARKAQYIGPVSTDPPRGYLVVRGIL